MDYAGNSAKHIISSLVPEVLINSLKVLYGFPKFHRYFDLCKEKDRKGKYFGT